MTERNLLYIVLAVLLALNVVGLFKTQKIDYDRIDQLEQKIENRNESIDSLIKSANDTSKYRRIQHETRIYINSVNDLDSTTLDSLYAIARYNVHRL